ncbi:LysR family transcriptional regulator [Actinomyces wuliandei]|uniref:LysR family transcriptional regulator n=1 Tax=Actinomyces wuliandei TaxID=2057743 RepID=UPI0019D4D085|nr:LysR family transcriptional regulator [Actinomyces wuliandei]
MEIQTLRYFLAVAREENMTRAAGALHVTQPTLSKQVRSLERELGTSCSPGTPSASS